MTTDSAKGVEASGFVPGVTPVTAVASADSLWFLFRKAELLLRAGDVPSVLQYDELHVAVTDMDFVNYLGSVDDRDCYTADLMTAIDLPLGLVGHPLRSTWGVLPDQHFAIAGRAMQVVEWDRTHQFCGQCGGSTERTRHERSRFCPSCNLTNYPRVAPAVIVLIEHEGRVLLARNAKSTAGFYSCLAGFVEPGESLEDCIRREVFEEASIEVDQIRYFGSQPWPFPHSLMIGFTARYAGGTLTLAEDEIADASWFGPNELPHVPAPLSIARKLIDDFVARHNGDPTGPGLHAWRS